MALPESLGAATPRLRPSPGRRRRRAGRRRGRVPSGRLRGWEVSLSWGDLLGYGWVLGARVGLPGPVELAAETAFGPMQTNPERGRRLAEHRCRLGRPQAVPCDQRDRLAVVRRQSSERGRYLAGRLLDRGSWRGAAIPALQAQAKRTSPSRSSLLGGDHVSGDGQEPRQRIGRHLVDTPPGNQERACHDVVGRVAGRAASRVRRHRPVVTAEQLLESLRSPSIPIVRVTRSGHHPPLAGRRPIVTSPRAGGAPLPSLSRADGQNG